MASVFSAIYLILFCFILNSAEEDYFTPHGLKCPENTTYGLYSDCIRRCDNYDKPKVSCPGKLEKGCKCKDGYLPLDRIHGFKCVLPKDCPEFEEFDLVNASVDQLVRILKKGLGLQD